MDSELRELERAALESPRDTKAGLAYARALGRSGQRRLQFREWQRLSRLGLDVADQELASWSLTLEELARSIADPLDRWSPTEEFLAAWHGGLTPGDGYTAEEVAAAERRLGLELPVALREWLLLGAHCRAARRQNRPYPPERLYVRESALIFREENQRDGLWGVLLDDLHLLDPPVYLFARQSADQRERQNERVSQFVIHMLLVETLAVAPVGGGGFSQSDVARIAGGFGLLGLPSWHYPAFPTVLYGRNDVLLHACGEDDRIWIGVAARSREALDVFMQSLDPATRTQLDFLG